MAGPFFYAAEMLLGFEKKLACFIEAHNLFGSVEKVVLAVSGGADSTALLHAVHALRAENLLSTELICAHVNHQLRGAEADSDEQFVISEAARLSLAATSKRVDVRSFARDRKLSIETAARQCRIGALTDIAKANHCGWIATAHQKNDNAETILHRLIRGTGFRGLGGIWPERTFDDGVTFIRPMLCVTRDEVIEYLQARNLIWRQDQTNVDCAHKRNFIRYRLLPAVQSDCRDSIVETFSELAYSARGFYVRICRRANKLWPGVAECTSRTTTLDLHGFLAQPPPVKIELIRRSLTRLGGGLGDLNQRHYERIVQLAASDVTARRIDLPNGFIVRRENDRVIFFRDHKIDGRISVSSPVTLKVPGRTRFDKCLIEATVYEADGCLEFARHDAKGCMERFDLEKLKLPISIRLRRAGDRFVPLGLGVEKKIGKFVTAQRVPREMRKKVVLVEDQEKVIWVWPVRISERAKITADTRRILQLQITQ